MKRNNQAALAILSWLVLATSIFAQDTNDVFYPEEPEEGNYPNLFSTAREEHDAHLRETAIKNGECRPAELDPEGHWGLVVYGFQASIRSKTNVFLVGTNIPVAIVFRNTTTNVLSIPSVSKGMESSFVIEDEAGQIVSYDNHKFQPGGSAYGFRPFAPKHQTKIEYDLNTQFSLKPGTYKICTEWRVFEQSPITKKITNYTNLYSGVLTIKVVPP